MTISHRISGNKEFFIATEGEQRAGVMTCTPAGPDKFIIDHTEVDSAFEGKGVGKQLVLAAVEHARANGLKIVPLCTYAKMVFERNPDLHDVLFRP